MSFDGETLAERMMLRRRALKTFADQVVRELFADEMAIKRVVEWFHDFEVQHPCAGGHRCVW